MSYLDQDAPFKSFKKRLSSGQLRTPQLDEVNRQRFGLVKQPFIREAVIADRIAGMSEEEWTRRIIERRQNKLV